MNEDMKTLKPRFAALLSLADDYLRNPSSKKAARICNEIKLHLKPLVEQQPVKDQSNLFGK